MYVMFAQSTPISYHTEGLIKTEVMSTVALFLSQLHRQNISKILELTFRNVLSQQQILAWYTFQMRAKITFDWLF